MGYGELPVVKSMMIVFDYNLFALLMGRSKSFLIKVTTYKF